MQQRRWSIPGKTAALWLAAGIAGCGQAPSAPAGNAAATAPAARSSAVAASDHEEPAMSSPTTSTPIAGLPLPTCAEVASSGLSGAALADAFDARYPAALNDADRIETLALDQRQIAGIVGYLVCVAGRTGGDVGVAETGYTLFGSRRHGAAAFAALDRMAEGGDEASAARAYAVQMRGYVDR